MNLCWLSANHACEALRLRLQLVAGVTRQSSSLPAASVRSGASSEGPPAEDIAQVNPQLSRTVTLPIEHVLRQPSEHPRAAVLDFSVHSAAPRFHLVERASGRVLQSLRVAHGQASEGSRQDGRAEVFSNVPDSNASSLGLYRTAEIYVSDVFPGLAMRMDGRRCGKESGLEDRDLATDASRSRAPTGMYLSNLQGGALIYAFYEMMFCSSRTSARRRRGRALSTQSSLSRS